MSKAATITTVSQAEREQCAEVERELLRRLRVLAPKAEALRRKCIEEEKALRLELFDYLNANRNILYKADSIVVAKKTGLRVTTRKPPSTSIIKLLQAGMLESAGRQLYGFQVAGKGQPRLKDGTRGYQEFVDAVLAACDHWMEPEPATTTEAA